VKAALQQFTVREFHQPFSIHANARVEFSGAGHLLGAAMTTLTVNENGKQTVLGFTGDIGRPNSKLVPDPEPLNGLDYLISESTYGGRKHKIQLSAEEELLGHITRTCVEKRGDWLFPHLV
jgi:metallo-beta-lactamase family protein